MFTGNPGTGKTTVARLVGEIYRDLGLLRRGHVFEAKVRDLISSSIGRTAERTDDAVDRALDGVLFIDEAYTLSDQLDGYGGQAIQALLSRMENDRGRLVVVAAGYPGKMREFLAADVGLSSRFPTVLDFPDFPAETLLAILLGRLTQRGERLEASTEEKLGAVVAEMYRTRDESFGNARDMRTLADDILRLWAGRVRGRTDLPITPEDIPERHRPRLGRPIPDPVAQLAELDRYVGLDAVREHFTTLGNRLRLRQAAGKGGFVAPHLLFTGPPGTGKTTVARVVGRMFRDLGLLRQGHVIEVTRAELVANFVGQTATRVQKAVRDALDGVLFIDEAYSLTRDTASRSDFGQEAVDTLIREMENRRGRLVVIAAGYPREMAEFLESNSGMASRFADPVVFPPYSGADLAEILRRMAADEGYALGAGVAERAVRWLEWKRAGDPVRFGNARTVRGLLGDMEGRMAARLAQGAGRRAPAPQPRWSSCPPTSRRCRSAAVPPDDGAPVGVPGVARLQDAAQRRVRVAQPPLDVRGGGLDLLQRHRLGLRGTRRSRTGRGGERPREVAVGPGVQPQRGQLSVPFVLDPLQPLLPGRECCGSFVVRALLGGQLALHGRGPFQYLPGLRSQGGEPVVREPDQGVAARPQRVVDPGVLAAQCGEPVRDDPLLPSQRVQCVDQPFQPAQLVHLPAKLLVLLQADAQLLLGRRELLQLHPLGGYAFGRVGELPHHLVRTAAHAVPGHRGGQQRGYGTDQFAARLQCVVEVVQGLEGPGAVTVADHLAHRGRGPPEGTAQCAQGGFRVVQVGGTQRRGHLSSGIVHSGHRIVAKPPASGGCATTLHGDPVAVEAAAAMNPGDPWPSWCVSRVLTGPRC